MADVAAGGEVTFPVAAAGGRATDRSVDVGMLIAPSPAADPDRLRSLAARMAADAVEELAATLDADWRFQAGEPTHLADSRARRPSEFLDEATERMVEGPFDVTVVVTDVPLLSRRERPVPGLASPLGRVAVISSAKLSRTRPETSHRSLDDEAVRWNAATLLLHLVGHLLGAEHTDGDGVMAPFRVDPERRSVPTFDADAERYLDAVAAEVPQEEVYTRGPLRRIAFYGVSVARNPGTVLRALLLSRAPLLPLSLPKLSTAALTPTLVIVFSAEAWDVGFHLSDLTAALFAVTSIVAAAVYLLSAQNLTFPRRHHRVLTEHAALVNVTVFLVLLGAMAGLFVLVDAVILLIEFVVFPPNLMSNWPSLEDPAVGAVDLLRTGAFISTIGVLSGAMAGGLENRAIIRHLTLFLDRP